MTYLVYVFGMYGAVVIFYTTAYIMMRLKHSWHSTSSTQQNQELEKKDRRFLYQGFTIALPYMMNITFNHLLMTNENLTELMLLCQAAIYLVCTTINPFVYLWFNDKLRKDVRVMLGIGKSSVHPNGSSTQANPNQPTNRNANGGTHI